MSDHIETLFSPKNIAVVGVSEDPTKLASVIWHNILDAGFTGQVFPINPKYPEIEGVKVYPNLEKLPEPVDLVVIVVPARFVMDVVKDAGRNNSKNLVVISAGFGETGEQGKILEQRVYREAQKNGIRIIGPNCLGVISTKSSVNATFASHNPEPGNIALMSQSGAINTAILDLSMARGLGFSHFVSFGNKVDINELDLLEAWLKDPDVKAIGIYLEEISSGREFINIIQSNPHKPIVLLYAGTSIQGKMAANSHTGSMTSDIEIIRTALKKVNVILVESIERFFNTLMLMSWVDDIPTGNRVKMITNAGGPGILATDMFSHTLATIDEPSEKCLTRLKAGLPEAASTGNPIDILGDADAKRFKDTIEIVAQDSETDIIVVILTPQYVTEIYETARVIITATAKFNKPIIPIFIGDYDVKKGLNLMWRNKIPAFDFIEEAASAINHLLSFTNSYSHQSDELIMKEISDRTPQHKERFPKLSSQSIPLNPQLSRDLALEVDLPLPVERVVSSLDDAIEFSQQNGYPVVIKATTEDAAHKTDTDLLFLNIQSGSDLVVKYNQLVDNLKLITGKETPNILIQEMFSGKEELIIGVKRDGNSDVYSKLNSGFGHVLLFGKGGVYTEVYKDVNRAVVPITEDSIKDLIDSTNVSKILYGIRGKAPLAHEKVVEIISAIQKMVILYPEISEIDINPVLIDENRAVAVDLKIFVKK